MAGLLFIKAGPSGGPGGGPFSVIGESLLPGGNPHHISLINIWSGIYIDAIQLQFTDALGNTAMSDKFGGSGGTLTTFSLAPGEFINEIVGTYSQYVGSMIITTNMRKLPGLGTPGHRQYTYNNNNLQKPIQIQGIFGSSGIYLDSFGVFIADD